MNTGNDNLTASAQVAKCEPVRNPLDEVLPELPWAVDDELPPNARCVIFRIGDVPISSDIKIPMRFTDRSIARFIVHAVNNHAALVERCKALEDALSWLSEDCESLRHDMRLPLSEAVRHARSLLSQKAGGK